jgi:hypothetical protein
MNSIKIYTFFISLVIVAWACNKTVEDPTPNPYLGLNNGNTNPTPDTTSPQSLRNLHKNIFAVKCANPTCHDGSFEPDFRTPESTYLTLVYHPVVKNDTAGSFMFRVVPKNVPKSWLHYRLITDDNDIGRMPLYNEPLNNEELSNIIGWINKGCPDASGVVRNYPNMNPYIGYYVAYNQNGQRIDLSRTDGWASPFIVNAGSNVELRVLMSDDSTLTSDLQIKQIKISQDRENFSAAQTFDLSFYYNTFCRLFFTSSSFTNNQKWYFRFYAKDATNPTIVEYPKNSSYWWIKEHHSFIIQ